MTTLKKIKAFVYYPWEMHKELLGIYRYLKRKGPAPILWAIITYPIFWIFACAFKYFLYLFFQIIKKRTDHGKKQ